MAFGNVSIALIIFGLCGLATAAWLRLRKRKSAAEREQERRLAVNANGRLTEGLLMEGDCPVSDFPNGHLLFYRYRAAGVEYSAAQDITSLLQVTPAESCVPGRTISVKYDPRNPSNSILVCELWSGLPHTRIHPDHQPESHTAPQRETTLAN